MATIYRFKGNVLKPVMDDLTARRRYNQAKVFKEHIEAILKVFDLTSKSLHQFQIYGPVFSVLSTMQLERTMLQAYLKECDYIIKNKGKV